MNTFNLGFVIGEKSNLYGGTHIIVCASEDPIDIHSVCAIAADCLPAALVRYRDTKKAIAEITKTIQQKCGCQAVAVSADVLLHAVAMK